MSQNSIIKFIKRNTLIFVIFITSICSIVAYYLTIDLPELFSGAEQWFNLLFQLSVGYVINFMFYVTQVYIPDSKREHVIHQKVFARLRKIIAHMKGGLNSLAQIYLIENTSNSFSEEDLSILLHSLRFSDKVNVLNAAKTTGSNMVYFSVREWLRECIHRTEEEIDKLYRYYSTDISIELMEILEDILNSRYHTIMKTLLDIPNDVDFSQCKDNFLSSYYKLICKLEEINKKEYRF